MHQGQLKRRLIPYATFRHARLRGRYGASRFEAREACGHRACPAGPRRPFGDVCDGWKRPGGSERAVGRPPATLSAVEDGAPGRHRRRSSCPDPAPDTHKGMPFTGGDAEWSRGRPKGRTERLIRRPQCEALRSNTADSAFTAEKGFKCSNQGRIRPWLEAFATGCPI